MHLALVNTSPIETYEVSKKRGNETNASPLLEIYSHVSIIRTLLNLQTNVGVNHCSIIAYGLQENHLHNLPNHHLSDCACCHTPPYCTYTFSLYYSYVLRMHSKLIPQKNKLQINHLAFSFCQFHEHVSTCNCAVSSIKYPHLHITD